MAKYKVAIVGASGYGGAELVRLLLSHPEFEITQVTSARSAGKRLQQECPWLATDLILTPFEPEKITADFTFLCQEKGFAMDHVATLLPRTRVLDLSADFRIKDPAVYKQYYGIDHRAPEFLEEAVYGLPELIGSDPISKARLVAVPGCYPTASGLAIAPIAEHIDGVPVVDAKSGVSGAGRSRTETDYLFSELVGGFKAYGVNGHRHTPEIEMFSKCPVRFTPHLIPAARGIHSTIHAPIQGVWTLDNLRELYRSFYEGWPCVQVVDAPPTTKQVMGANTCALYVDFDPRTNYIVVCSVIDNLCKGAAGQAVQCLNLMAGLEQTAGLPMSGLWP